MLYSEFLGSNILKDISIKGHDTDDTSSHADHSITTLVPWACTLPVRDRLFDRFLPVVAKLFHLDKYTSTIIHNTAY